MRHLFRDTPNPPKAEDKLTQALQYEEALEFISARVIMWREPLVTNPDVEHITTLDLHALRN